MRPPDARAHFGRKKGHRLRPAQAERLERLLPRLALDLSRPAPRPLADLFAAPVGEVWLEIGFGGGEHLLATAERHRDIGLIGCEAFTDGMAKLLAGIEARAIDTIRPHFGDAVEVLDWLPDHSVARIFLLYPDPWPKRRHWKRRFVSTERLAAMTRVLEPGGRLHFASDISSYVSWTLFHATRNPALRWTARRPDDWRRPWAGWPSTRYEHKALREGRTPSYLTFERL